jgi:S-adenosylmethionine-dependent carboxyl methyltransferase
MSEPDLTPASSQRTTASADAVMKGHGFYNEHSRPQHKADSLGLPLLERAVEEMAVPRGAEPAAVADFGAAQGRNSLGPMRLAVEKIRRQTTVFSPIVVIHTDLPQNDFGSLFALVEASPESYLRSVENVFALAAGKSFYERIFPEGYISLGWTAISVHWLSKVPCSIPDHVYAQRAGQRVRKAYAEQASEDWLRFLGHRARELRPGGELIVVAVTTDDSGNTGGESLMDLTNEPVLAMVEAGSIRSEEYGRMNMPAYHRTMEEFTEPLRSGTLTEDLILKEGIRVGFPDQLWPEYEQTGDANAFAASYTEFMRAFTEAPLFTGLDPDRTLADRERLTNEYFERMRSLIEANPERARWDWQVALLRVAKKGQSSADTNRFVAR